MYTRNKKLTNHVLWSFGMSFIIRIKLQNGIVAASPCQYVVHIKTPPRNNPFWQKGYSSSLYDTPKVYQLLPVFYKVVDKVKPVLSTTLTHFYNPFSVLFRKYELLNQKQYPLWIFLVISKVFVLITVFNLFPSYLINSSKN